MRPMSPARTLPTLAAAMVVALASATPAWATAPTRARGAGELRDLQVATSQPTDHATAQVVAIESDGSTTVTLKVQGLAHEAAGMTLGAHVHVGSCIEGNGAAAGGHYNSTGGATISNQTEVWLDFVVGEDGTGNASTTVPFVIGSGAAGAVVIHAAHTDSTTGLAGARWACLPVPF